RLAEWALSRGASPNAEPARDPRFPKRSLYELAVMEDLPEIAELLARHGSARTEVRLDDFEQFGRACFRLDRATARRLAAEHAEYCRSFAILFEAARRDRPDVMALLLDLGVPLEVQDATGKQALHEAAAAGAAAAARFLIDCGAEVDPRESTYGSTPI